MKDPLDMDALDQKGSYDEDEEEEREDEVADEGSVASATGKGKDESEKLDQFLLRRYHLYGDRQARDKLITMYLPLVRSLARRYSSRGEHFDDLVQVGSIGLIKAIDRFDLSRGVELTTYATPNIIGEIKRYFRDKGWSVRVPRGLQELNIRLNKVIDQLVMQLETDGVELIGTVEGYAQQASLAGKGNGLEFGQIGHGRASLLCHLS